MSCSNCKQKPTGFDKEKFDAITRKIEKKVLWGIGIWTLLGLYGLYSLIVKLL